MQHKLTVMLRAAVLAFAVAGIPAPVMAAAAKPYPLKTCLVTGNELGSMGKVIAKTYEGREVKFCCKPCVKKFDANPVKYLKKLK